MLKQTCALHAYSQGNKCTNTDARLICSSQSLFHALGIIVNLLFIYLFTDLYVLSGSPRLLLNGQRRLLLRRKRGKA